jgi:outer membrane protein|tara:strand:+ start:116 stop:586 length:471 start_codon:yes stop_codon:yes gene_type:complete
LTLFSHGQKFAFVDSEYILDQMESYQKAQKQIDDLAAEWQKELDKKVGNIESKVNDLRKNELLLPEDIKEEKELEITTLQNELRAYQSKKFGVGGDLFKRRKELIQPIQRKVFKAIESLAKDNNYSFVLDKSKNSNILYADPKYDKSDAIIRKLKK